MKIYSEEFIKTVVSFGMVGYPLNKILNIVPDEIDLEQFIIDFNDTESIIYKSYVKGVDRADYDIDIRLFELAKSGDLNALQVFEKRKRLRSLDD